ncbi:enoyl-CoA hydratase/isomerase family protein [Arthrobacter sp. MA-N2]|uniref:enoyl-CoA hydratase/isomerase family protein n=1 Tax=Arthrobacter sp. MA-N2 TaxID=1101188 RepID=UPI0004B33638|nr:enoyl-CoA hydratase/isomerase family protein [Arthrobacter sp. MA-N2]
MRTMAEENAVQLSIHGRTGRIVLQRGEKNLLNAQMCAQLYDGLRSLDENPGVGAIVITGAGDHFCGGADGAHIRETGTAGEFAAAVVDLFGYFPESTTPIIAAVNGDALAGGFGLACSADIVIAVDTAQLGTIEARLGTWPAIAQVAAARRVPLKAAITNALTGDPFDAARSLALGIVDEVVPREDLDARIEHYAEAVMRSGEAVRIGRPLFYRSLNQEYRTALHEGAAGFTALFGG